MARIRKIQTTSFFLTLLKGDAVNIGSIARSTQSLVKHNAPVILTSVAVVGTVTTAFLAGQAGWKVANLVHEYEARRDDPILGPDALTRKEIVKIAWPYFLPAVGVGALTVSCILGANHLQGRRAAALAGAYSLSEKAFTEYRDKVVEQIGATKEVKVRDAVAQDQADKDAPRISEIVIQDAQEWVCYETLSGRYFTTTVEKINQATNTFNKKLLDDMYGSLNDFWDLLGLEGTTVGDELGWTQDRLMDTHITTTLGKNKQPCLSLGYIRSPEPNYWKFR